MAIKKNKEDFIGVFDSGVGGLSVLRELKKALPNENFVFLADQLNVPYGEKSQTELIKIGSQIIDFLVKNYNVKMVVVACNTSSTYAVPTLRGKYPFPIISTIPAVKVAIKNTKTKEVAVISTPATSKSLMLKNLIKDNKGDVIVHNIGCKDLVSFVEKGEVNTKEVKNSIETYFKEIKGGNTDYLVLGCTHYPFLKTSIRGVLGSKVNLIDASQAISKRAKKLLVENNLKIKTKRKGKTIYLTTLNEAKFTKTASKLLQTKVKASKVKV